MTTRAKPFVPVSERALIARINRRLKKDWQKLVKTRGLNAILSIGEYYVLDSRRNLVWCPRVDIEDLGRELKVLKDYERLDKAE